MAQIHISQIAGAGMVSSGLNWYPDVPTIQIIDVNPGAVNDITTIALCKQDPTQDLYFKAPVDVYRNNVLIGRKGEYIKTTRLDNGVLPFTLNEKDTNYPFAVLVYYKYTTDTIHIEQGEAVSTDVTTPSLPANCITLGVHIEPKQGDEYIPPVVPATVNYFEPIDVDVSTSTSYTLDFKYSQTNIYITETGAPGSVELNIYYPTYYSGNSTPIGKTMIVRIYIVSGSPTVVWNGANFKTSDSSITMSTSSTKVNVYTVAHYNKKGIHQYQLDNVVYNI
jgi:hypothetical protein